MSYKVSNDPKFSEEMKSVISLAKDSVGFNDVEVLFPSNLMWALTVHYLSSSNSLIGKAIKILYDLGVYARLSNKVGDMITKSFIRKHISNVQLSQNAEEILKNSITQASLLNSEFVETEHLLLAMLCVHEKTQIDLSPIFNELNLTYIKVWDELRKINKDERSSEPTRFQRKLQVMMNVAKEFASLSTCSRKQVGSIITKHNLSQVVSVGYNGGYSGDENKCESSEPSKCGCAHAETNSLLKFNPDSGNDFIMFCTLSICKTCAKNLINVGAISTIIYNEEYRLRDGIDLIEKHGKIHIYQLSELLNIKNLERLPHDYRNSTNHN